MADNQHLVYVIYRDGVPIDPAGGRPAYLTKSTARAQAMRLARNSLIGLRGYRAATRIEVIAEMERYTIVPYGRVSE